MWANLTDEERIEGIVSMPSCEYVRHSLKDHFSVEGEFEGKLKVATIHVVDRITPPFVKLGLNLRIFTPYRYSVAYYELSGHFRKPTNEWIL